MSTILIKDALRASVEAASGGAQTVLYTAKGQPTFMNIVEKFDLSTIASGLVGTHPAFIINGTEKDLIYIGTYEAVFRNGELLSLPNQVPSALSFNEFVSYAKVNGAGHHMMTNAEWSALALKAWKSGTLPLGNSYYGRSTEDATQYGRRADGLSAQAGITTGNPISYSGSGPVSWRHNAKYNGIADLVGNMKTRVLGARMVFNELQVIPNNDAANPNIDISVTSEAWKAIDARTGDYITPNGSGTTPYAVKFVAADSTADYGIRAIGTFNYITQSSSSNPVSEVALNVLRKLALFPMLANDQLASDGFGISPSSSDALLSRGGHYSEGVSTGIFATRFGDTRTTSSNALGSRTAYYKP